MQPEEIEIIAYQWTIDTGDILARGYLCDILATNLLFLTCALKY